MQDKAKKASSISSVHFSLTVHSTSVLEGIYIFCNLFQGVIMYKKTSFLITGSIVMAAVVTVSVANAQSVNTINTARGENMTKSMNMTAGGGNMTKSMNMTLEVTR